MSARPRDYDVLLESEIAANPKNGQRVTLTAP